MRVLLISKSFSKGGAASGASGLRCALNTAGVETIVCDALASSERSPLYAARMLERVIERGVFGLDKHCVRLARPTFRLEELVAEYQPDIVQMCDISGNVVDLAALRKIGCPVVHRLSDFWPYHGSYHYALTRDDDGKTADFLLRSMVFDGTSLPDAIVAPSHWLAKSLRISPKHKEVIRNSTALPGRVRAAVDIDKRIRFGFISNKVFDPRKGFLGLRDFLKPVSRAGFDVELHVFGSIRESEKSEISGASVIWHGPFVRSELERVYSSFDVLLCPSIQDNSPNVVCEALAHGLPVAGQTGTGMESYIYSEFGCLVDFSEHKEGAEELASFCRSLRQGYAEYSRRARNFVETKLSPSTIGEQYSQLYQRLLN